MKSKILNSVAIILLLITCSCANKSKQLVAYNTIASLEQAVTASYKAYLDLVATEKLPLNSMRDVGVAYDSFHQAETIAINAAQGNKDALASPALLDAANNVLNLINRLKGVK